MKHEGDIYGSVDDASSFLVHQIEMSFVFTHVRSLYLTDLYQLVETIKNEQPHVRHKSICDVIAMLK